MLTLIASATLSLTPLYFQDDEKTTAAAPKADAKKELAELTAALGKADSYSFSYETEAPTMGGRGRGDFGGRDRGGRGDRGGDRAGARGSPTDRSPDASARGDRARGEPPGARRHGRGSSSPRARPTRGARKPRSSGT